MSRKRRADLLVKHSLVLPGAAGHIPYLAGVYRAIEDFGLDTCEVSGTSSGGITASGVAHGMTSTEMLDAGSELLYGNRLLRRHVLGPVRAPYGIFSLSPLRNALHEMFPGVMGDAVLPWGVWVQDAQRSTPWFISSDDMPTMKTCEVVTATSALAPYFTMHKIPGIDGLFYDGGYGANVGEDAWDGTVHPTLVVRLGQQGRGRQSRPIRNVVDAVRSMTASLVDAASRTHVSRKHWLLTATIETQGDGLDFDQSGELVVGKFYDAREQMSRWLDAPYV